MTAQDSQTLVTVYKPTYFPANTTSSQVRTYENVFLEEIIKNNFDEYYNTQLNTLALHYAKKEVALTDELAEPFMNINELL